MVLRSASRRDAVLAPFHGATVELAPTTAQAIDAFLSDLELAGRSRATLAPYRSYLKPLLAHRHLAEISDADLRPLILARLRVNVRTAYAVHTVLASFFAYAERHGWGESPMRRIPRPKKKDPEHRYLSRGEVERVWAAAHTVDTRLVRLLLLLGLRAREVLGLTWADVDWHRQELHVRVTKGGRPRRVWFNGQTRAMLEARHRTGKAIIGCHYAALRERLARLSRRSGVSFTAHTWRRTWASHAFLEGMNQASVQRLGGWSGALMAEFYARSALDEAALRESARFDLTRRLLDDGADEREGP